MNKHNLTQSLRYEAIQSLSGGEKDKIDWMLKNMHFNKTYKYFSIPHPRQSKTRTPRT